MSNAKEMFGNMFKSKRAEFAMTQKACAKEFGVSIVTIQNWENGIIMPKKDKLEKICAFFKTDKEVFTS